MKPETLYLVIAIIVGLGTIGGMLASFTRWLGRVDENTRATDRLTAAFEKAGNMLLDHEKRLTRLEARDDG